MKRAVLTVWLAARDGRVAWPAKAIAFATAAYALSPIDLIPDFVPVLGYLDDLVIVPLGVAAVLRLVRADVLADLRARAERMTASPRPQSRAGAAAVILAWVGSAALAGWALLGH